MLSIMSYDGWMRLTKAGLSQPRSKELRQLDMALQNDTLKRDPASFDALYAAALAWKSCKDDPFTSIRNRNGAVERLFKALAERRGSDRAGSAAQAKAVADIGRMGRPGGLLEDIRGGKAKMDAGELSGKFAKAGLAVVTTDANSSNVHYEGFGGGDLVKAKQGWADALRCAQRTAASLQSMDLGMLLNSPVAREVTRYTTWFGPPTRETVSEMKTKAEVMLTAMRKRPITFVLRKN